jgi:hypothetical protein
MERLLKNQQISLVQVIDPISGQQYYAPESAIYTTSTDSNPVILKNVTVDQATTASSAQTSSYALTHETTVSTYLCTGRLGTDQIIFSGSDNKIKFSRDIDPNGWLSGTPNFRVTPTYPGYYSVSAGALFENPNDITSQLNLQGRKNGNAFAIFQTPTNNITEQSLTFTKTIYLNGTTDYIDFSVYQGTPANISLITGSALSSGTWFSMNLITM